MLQELRVRTQCCAKVVYLCYRALRLKHEDVTKIFFGKEELREKTNDEDRGDVVLET